jgi:NAD(P)H dehydrogenase (quinone)
MSKKILIINGHPNRDSFNFALAEFYKNGVESQGVEVKEIVISELNFNPSLSFGYQKRMDLETDLLESWDKILWADHLVWIHPVWWGGLPAITKGFIDRLFLPGMAFQYRENSVWWDKLLKGKTAHIITTLDQPSWYYRLMTARPSVNQLKKATLEFCGVSPVQVSYFENIKTSTPEKRAKFLERVQDLGIKDCK